MRNIYWILIFISSQSFSQNSEWRGYKLDSLAEFQLPSQNANLFDSIDNGIKIYELSAKFNGINYVGSKSKVEQFILPSNKTELTELYNDAIFQIAKSFPNSIETKTDIVRNGYQGLKYILLDENNIPLYSAELYLLEDNLFMFYCINDAKDGSVESDYFFKSILLVEKKGAEQITGDSSFLKMIKLFKIEIIVILGIIGLIVVLIIRNRKKTA
ncbi:hypothetical protein [Ulvibacter litoralis]|uniref:Uncharacterized protein n=1 Tax=Ulvibacter litoralis TaxID=227084 RepID=A0A1G7JIA2_9FLAO|nr:hypothetical protein [Ulvibacter litoralis]GHC58903.1 hypothetical protein GCM10008083_24510 [Ulvibacter litoralis]SDF24650.1 hypothetical protein SAMN05421855_1152 [Ulvibacter litoralis]